MLMTEIHQVGESLQIIATIEDITGSPVSPTSVVISIKKPDGTMAVTDGTMSSIVVGTYYYDFVIDSARVYRVSIKATGSGGRVTIEPDRFVAEDAI